MKNNLFHILILIPVFIAIIPLRILIDKAPKMLWLWTIIYIILVLVLYLIGKKYLSKLNNLGNRLFVGFL